MPEPQNVEAAYWDYSLNTTIGCKPSKQGCKFCYAPRLVIPYAEGWQAGEEGLYHDVVDVINGQPVFNGKLATLPAGDRVWTQPLRWKGAEHPKLGEGQPSLIFLTTMGDLLYEHRPQWAIDRTCALVAQSDHIGLVVTRHSVRAAQYFGTLDPRTARIWRRKLWLVFSAAEQTEFDEHWTKMRSLAASGWLLGVSCSPLIGEIVLPNDFLALGRWVIVNGECGGPYVPDERLRPMKVRWAFALLDQCAAAGIPFFMRGMGKNRPIPKKLQVREFPKATCT
jgi:protein gp37